MKVTRALRYLAPNLITAAGICFGLLALKAILEGRFIDSAWWVVYAVLTDRIDGFVARLVRGTSELGVQLDSFADFLNFGLVPAVLMYVALSSRPELPFADGGGQLLLMSSCAVWVFGATFRLARYNITPEEPGHSKIFFGIPTTMAAGLLIAWYLTFIKYTGQDGMMAEYLPVGGMRLFGDSLVTPEGVWRLFPVFILLGGVLMASSLRMPKLGLMSSKAFTAFVMINVLCGYVVGFARIMPEYIILPPSMWFVTYLVWGQLSREARAMRPPAIFPEVDPPPGKEPLRPEDDLLPDGHMLDADGHSVPDGSAPGKS